MNVLVLDPAAVREVLPMPELIECMDQTLRTLGEGDAVQPLRSATWLPDRRGLIGMMPGYLGAPSALGAKVVTVFPGNHGTGLDSHQGLVMLFDSDDGRLLALLDGSEVTAIRTAAVSAVATRALAKEDACDLALIGTGTQALTHLEALRHVRELRRVRVYSRSEAHRADFVEAARGLDVEVEPVDSAEAAVRGADLVCTVTSSPEPVVKGAWLEPGAHVNAVGACTPRARELDTEAVARSTLIVDRRESAENESGEVRLAMEEGAIGPEHVVAELGDVLLGRHPGRSSAEELTLFDSLGLAVEDLAAAELGHRIARERGLGVEVKLGGERP